MTWICCSVRATITAMRLGRVLLVVSVACARAKSPAPTIPLAAHVSPESAEAAYEAKNWSECAAQWSSVSERATGDDKAGALYDAACCYALDGRLDAAVAAFEQALDAGYWDAAHAIADDDLAALRAHPKWPALQARANAAFAAFEGKLGEPALRRELLALAEKDQQAHAAIRGADDKAAIEAAAALDREHALRAREIVAKHGWPGKSLVGSDGANAAWLLVQHADIDLDFQRECVAKMEPLVKTGEVAGRDYAFLWDRVAVRSGKPQRYGTQMLDGDELAPLEDPANVDARRAELGMPRLTRPRTAPPLTR